VALKNAGRWLCGGEGGPLQRLFALRENRTTPGAEVLGGMTTFVTMAYIIVVNPAILKFAGLPEGPATVATILTAVFGTLLMGLYANRPIAVAPYMGENAFIAFGLTAMAAATGAAITWQQRLGSVFVGGVALVVLAVLGVRAWLANSISASMKHSFAVGIGLFLALIGLYETGIVASPVTGKDPQTLLAPDSKALSAPAVPLTIGELRETRVLLAIVGFVLMTVLLYWNVRGAILIGIVAVAVAGYAFGLGERPTQVVRVPWEYDLGQIAGQLDVRGVLQLSFLPILLTLFLMSFLDTLGTLVGVGAAGGMLDREGNFPGIERPMVVDGLSCMFGAVVGTSTSGAYIESATGIRDAARTGLAAVVTALLFAVALFFIPLAAPLQKMTYAYGPALIAVGVLMLGSVRQIDFDDMTEAVPAVTTILLMVFTYNIANGLTGGLLLYPVFKVLAGRWREVRPGAVALAVVCLVYFVYGLPH
jgi:AGZA family xanthine/uracil permease-like MFS transporter